MFGVVCTYALIMYLHTYLPSAILRESMESHDTSVAPIIGSVIGNTLYWLSFMNIGIGSVHLVNC